MAFIGNTPTAVPLTGSQIADGTIVNANIATDTINLTQKVTATLPFGKGGTGLSTLGTAGQALVVNSGATALQYSTVGASAGQVIQVVQGSLDTTSRSTSSASYVTASNTISASITPSSASNKILAFANFGITGTDLGGYFARATLYRGATNLGPADGFVTVVSDQISRSSSIIVLDSPSTTSSTTYQVYVKINDAGTLNLNSASNPGYITLMEIKG